jgi:Flp pilus assembly protein TadG
MQKRVPFLRPSAVLRRFQRSEDGSFTLEAIIWMPIFAILLAIMMNLSMVFFYESQMLRISQDATRAFSLGRITEEEAEQYISDRLAFIDAQIAIDTARVGDVAMTVVSTNAAELMPFALMSGPFVGVPIGVSTQYIIEF